MPEITMPWCSKGTIIVSKVDSCPPCSELVEVKTLAGFPLKVPESQCDDVVSKKYFNGAAMLPKRVGLPRTKPSQCSRSSRVT